MATTLYVVMDTLGDGRVLGVFSSREKAAKLVALDPRYYKLAERTLDRIDPDSIRWARSEKQRRALRRLDGGVLAAITTRLERADGGD